MTTRRQASQDARIQAALAVLEERIRVRYPDAGFAVFERDDPDGVRLRVTVDAADSDQVFDLVADDLYTFQVEQGLPIYAVPVHSELTVTKQLRSRRRRESLVDPLPLLRG